MDANQGVLLESGTNELDIIEFSVGDTSFGINILKVKEILNPVPITKVPRSHPYVDGVIELRGDVLPVINLSTVLGMLPSQTPSTDKLIVTEFNQLKLVFRVHHVNQIRRVSWGQIDKPSNVSQGLDSYITGIISLNQNMIMLLDFEKIVVEIHPEAGIHMGQTKQLGKRNRSDKRIIIAEDSPLLRSLLKDTLTEAGFSNLVFFENGREALHYLQSKSEETDIKEDVQLVITDIEMPQMDGHHLTKQIKSDGKLSGLPVIIFSSLITEELRHKGKMVGATEQVSKPEIVKLVQLIDKHIL
ncbi:chemotaxis protein [Bacillus timonensis]|nr:chemotaxis protein [Bacillus timonensis]